MSFKDSDGSDGCRLHIWATDHTTEECRVIQKQIDGMRAQYEAQPHNANKRQKNNNNQPKSGGDLHVLIATFNDVKARIEKELKQCSTACGKRKTVSFAEDVIIEKDDNKKIKKLIPKISRKTLLKILARNLIELTLSDVSDGDFEVLSELGDISEIE